MCLTCLLTLSNLQFGTSKMKHMSLLPICFAPPLQHSHCQKNHTNKNLPHNLCAFPLSGSARNHLVHARNLGVNLALFSACPPINLPPQILSTVLTSFLPIFSGPIASTLFHFVIFLPFLLLEPPNWPVSLSWPSCASSTGPFNLQSE